MNIDTVKIELINWIAKLNDQTSIGKILNLKKKLSVSSKKEDTKIFGSGKHLVDFIADDFKDPLDSFKEYRK